MSVMKACVYVMSAKPHFPAFSVVWRLRISSLCLKAPYVLKGGLLFSLAAALFAVEMC